MSPSARAGRVGTPRPKFRIDPTAPPAAPPPPPPPPAPAQAPPLLAPAAPAPASSRRRWLVWGAVGAAVLLAGAAVAVFVLGVGDLVYPQKYLLDKSEVPKGLRMSDPDAAGKSTQCETARNPCKLTAAALDDLDLRVRPKEGWIEGLDLATSASDSAPLTIAALKFGSAEDASTWLGLARLGCTQGSQHGAIFRDGDVVVVIAERTTAAGTYHKQVVAALTSKASGLTQVCFG